MPRDHFSKVMYSPVFNSPGYEDSVQGHAEERFYSRFYKIKQLVQKVRKKCGGRRTN